MSRRKEGNKRNGGLLSLTQRKKRGSLTFFDTKKEAKKYSPHQGLPAGGGCNRLRGQAALRQDFGMAHKACAPAG